jgi:two-component system, response regulator PdtaR
VDRGMVTTSAETAPAPRRRLRVLIVEDEPLTSLHLQSVLQELGHTVSGIAPSLRTALAFAAGAPSDLAIIDVGLAGDGGDGIDAAVALRKRHGIPALLMTGASFADLGPRLADAEPLGLLTKPCTEADVAQALEVVFSRLAPHE